MYQNIYVEKTDKNPIVHIWDDEKGKIEFPFKKYAYKKSKTGTYMSMYGDRLEKITNFGYDDDTLFESDVPVETRVLIDLYEDDDDVSTGHRLLIFDIEVNMKPQLPDANKAQNEITAISMYDAANDQYYVAVLDKNNVIKEESKTDNVLVIPFPNEVELLEWFLEKYIEIAPTILTGWNINYFDVPYLYNRLVNVFDEERASLLSPIGKVYFHPYKDRFCIAGVSILDYLVMYKKFNYSVEPSYRLDAIGKKEVNMGKVEYKGTLDDLLSEDILTFISYSLTDIKIVKALDDKLKFIELCRSVCHVGHVAYEEIWYSSKYLEGALLLYLRRNGLIAPNKKRGGRELYEQLQDDDEEGFTGAYVKEPVPGKYNWVFSCDVNSLYPSAIRTLNISPETKVGKVLNWTDSAHGFSYIKDGATLQYQFDDDCKELSKKEFVKMMTENNFTISSNGVVYSTDKMGIIPAILTKWFAERKEFQALMKKAKDDGDMVKMEFYKKRQHVQKILLNSLYGVLGLPVFRFYDIDNAEATTISGQEIIKMTEKFIHAEYNKQIVAAGGTPAEGLNNVIYCDTDSAYMSAQYLGELNGLTEYDQLKKFTIEKGKEFQDKINSFYDIMCPRLFNTKTHCIRIAADVIAKRAVWLAKKAYAMLKVYDMELNKDLDGNKDGGKLDVKGLGTVRSSFPEIFRKFMSEVLIKILTDITEKDLSARINEFENQIRNTSLDEIAKTSSVKEIEKWLKGVKQRKPFGEFAKLKNKSGGTLGCPAHVKAALYYNDFLEHYKIKGQYETIRDGEKAKWVYLRENPFRLDGLSFKGHSDPPQIMAFIEKYADKPQIFEKEMKKKLQNFYTALKWKYPSGNEEIASQFFDF